MLRQATNIATLRRLWLYPTILYTAHIFFKTIRKLTAPGITNRSTGQATSGAGRLPYAGASVPVNSNVRDPRIEK